MAVIPYIFYWLGSFCFLIGTTIAIVEWFRA